MVGEPSKTNELNYVCNHSEFDRIWGIEGVYHGSLTDHILQYRYIYMHICISMYMYMYTYPNTYTHTYQYVHIHRFAILGNIRLGHYETSAGSHVEAPSQGPQRAHSREPRLHLGGELVRRPKTKIIMSRGFRTDP